MGTTSSERPDVYTPIQVPASPDDHLGARIINGTVVLLAGWLLISPLMAGYAATDASNDVALAQIGAGAVIGATALPRVREPAGHPWLTACTAIAALLLLVFPWLTGVGANDEPPGLPPGVEDNGYAPFASANVVTTSSCVLVLTALALFAAAGQSGRATGRRSSSVASPMSDER